MVLTFNAKLLFITVSLLLIIGNMSAIENLLTPKLLTGWSVPEIEAFGLCPSLHSGRHCSISSARLPVNGRWVKAVSTLKLRMVSTTPPVLSKAEQGESDPFMLQVVKTAQGPCAQAS